ncbi:MAG: GxxExxY protein [Chloroflexi bacterium]|nr:GxxExxY protein [Chloroflexota bacterium]
MPQPSKHQFEKLSYKVIGACIDVQRQLGVHCMEVDSQRARRWYPIAEIALPKFGVEFEREVEIPLYYDGVLITRRRVDFVCWDKTDRLLLETKAASTIKPEDVEQSLFMLARGMKNSCCSSISAKNRSKRAGL